MKQQNNRLLQGLLIGIIFGFLLQRAGVTRYDVIIGQLLLEDFTVLKVIVTAIIVGMIGIYYLKGRGIIKLAPKQSSLMQVIPGGLIFGVGFALLGYCPGTLAGAIGQGSIDALIPGLIGIILGAALFAINYEKLKPLLEKGKLNKATLPELLHLNHWRIIIPVCIFLLSLLIILETLGH